MLKILALVFISATGTIAHAGTAYFCKAGATSQTGTTITTETSTAIDFSAGDSFFADFLDWEFNCASLFQESGRNKGVLENIGNVVITPNLNLFFCSIVDKSSNSTSLTLSEGPKANLFAKNSAGEIAWSECTTEKPNEQETR